MGTDLYRYQLAKKVPRGRASQLKGGVFDGQDRVNRSCNSRKHKGVNGRTEFCCKKYLACKVTIRQMPDADIGIGIPKEPPVS